MTDLATAEPANLSTTLDTETHTGPSGAGAPNKLPEEGSLRDAIAAAVKEDATKEDAKADAKSKDGDEGADKAKDEKAPEKGAEKPEGDDKPADTGEDKKGAERAADGKLAAKDKPEGDVAQKEEPKAEAKPENGHIAPPAKLLPDAKEKWTNVPRPVQRDVANLVREHEAEVTRYREAAERYEPLRRYDEAVRQSGRAGIHETLQEVAELETMMERNPLAALNQILLRAGPRKPDGQPVSLFELASAIVKSGQDNYQKMVATPVPQSQERPQSNPEVEQLKQQIADMQAQQLAATVIEPFKRDHPRYVELEQDIAFFLKSGKIPTSLSPLERLEAAYDMAARINPASHDAAEPQADPEPARRADNDFSGSKSIKSAPGAVSPDMEPDRGGSTRDVLMQELRRAARK